VQPDLKESLDLSDRKDHRVRRDLPVYLEIPAIQDHRGILAIRVSRVSEERSVIPASWDSLELPDRRVSRVSQVPEATPDLRGLLVALDDKVQPVGLEQLEALGSADRTELPETLVRSDRLACVVYQGARVLRDLVALLAVQGQPVQLARPVPWDNLDPQVSRVNVEYKVYRDNKANKALQDSEDLLVTTEHHINIICCDV